jgi:hypothetical protein
MMAAAVVTFVALLPRGGELRLKNDNAQAASVMALIMLPRCGLRCPVPMARRGPSLAMSTSPPPTRSRWSLFF